MPKQKAHSFALVLMLFFIVFAGDGFRAGAHNLKNAAATRAAILRVRGFSALDSENCTVLYSEADAEFAPVVLRAAQLYLPYLLHDFGLDSAQTALIIVQPDAGYFGAGESAPIGVYSGGVIHIMSPRLWAGESHAQRVDSFLSNGPVVHELAHFLLDTRTNGRYEPWFSEGMALFYEYKYTGVRWREDLAGGISDRPSIEELRAGFGEMDVQQGYRDAFEVLLAIVERFGEQELERIMASLAAGEGFDTVYERIPAKDKNVEL